MHPIRLILFTGEFVCKFSPVTCQYMTDINGKQDLHASKKSTALLAVLFL